MIIFASNYSMASYNNAVSPKSTYKKPLSPAAATCFYYLGKQQKDLNNKKTFRRSKTSPDLLTLSRPQSPAPREDNNDEDPYLLYVPLYVPVTQLTCQPVQVKIPLALTLPEDILHFRSLGII